MEGIGISSVSSETASHERENQIGIVERALAENMGNPEKFDNRCIGTLSLERVGQYREQRAADVPSAELHSDSTAGKMPAALWCSWNTSSRLSAFIGTIEPVRGDAP